MRRLNRTALVATAAALVVIGGSAGVASASESPDSVQITSDNPDSVRITAGDPDSVRITAGDNRDM